MGVYAKDCGDVAHAVRDWAIKEAGNPRMRIVLAGYESEHDMPDDWSVVHWKARGGYSSTSANETQGKANRGRERLWLSPACVQSGVESLYAGAL